MASTALQVADVAAVMKQVDGKPGDFRFVLYVMAIECGLRCGEPASCRETVLTVYGTPADLLPNGFLLGPHDIIELQEAGESGDPSCVSDLAKAYRMKAVGLARSPCPPADATSKHLKMLKCAFWLDRASVLEEAYRAAVPVTTNDLEV